MADTPTVYIIASDQSRNGKTMLARILADYLLLDGKDPFLIDIDAPIGPLRLFFPGRTALADFEKTAGRMKVFDTILAAPGRDYVLDLPQRHMREFFAVVRELGFFAAAKTAGFRVVVFFIVDLATSSLRAAQEIYGEKGINFFVPVKNDFVGSSWPVDEGALTLPLLQHDVALAISLRRFLLREFVLGDDQALIGEQKLALNRFMFAVLDGLNRLDIETQKHFAQDMPRLDLK